MYPVPGLDLERTVVASLLPLVVPAAGMTAIDDKYLDVMPKREEMNSAAVVFLVETSAEYVLVESLKGEIRVLDSLGKEEVLGAGEGFLEEWQASERVGGGGTVYIKGNE